MRASSGTFTRVMVGLACLLGYAGTFVLAHDQGGIFALAAVYMVALAVGAWTLGRVGGMILGSAFIIESVPIAAVYHVDLATLWGGTWTPNLASYYVMSTAFSVGLGYLVGAVGDYSRESRQRAGELALKNRELEQATARLAQSEEMFRQFADRIDIGAWIMPVDATRQSYQNPAADRYFGKSTGRWGKAQYEAWLRTVHPMDLAGVQASASMLSSGQPQDIEYRTVEDGQVRWFRSQSFPIRGADGKLESYVGLIQDITTQKERDAQRDIIERRERLTSLGSLVAGVAHEVNNPLTYMIGNVSLARKELARAQRELADGQLDPARLPRVDKLLESANGGGERIARIVKALRAVTQHRTDAGTRAPVDLNALATNVRELMHVNLPHHVKLELELDPHAPVALGRSDELHQVVLNLATNAVQALAHAKGGHVRIETRVRDGRALLRVVDDGPGMSEETRRKLFTPFFTTKADGTGLGLSIVHGIVRDHDGEIDVDTQLGVGTEFTVTLPLAPAQAPTAGGRPA